MSRQRRMSLILIIALPAAGTCCGAAIRPQASFPGPETACRCEQFGDPLSIILEIGLQPCSVPPCAWLLQRTRRAC